MSMTKLQHLNNLLAKNASELKLPAFRSHVGASGANQEWLAKAIKRHPGVNPEIEKLIELPFKQLLTEHHG